LCEAGNIDRVKRECAREREKDKKEKPTSFSRSTGFANLTFGSEGHALGFSGILPCYQR
jgi:hypothetical protein